MFRTSLPHIMLTCTILMYTVLNVTGPAKRDQVCSKYTIPQNHMSSVCHIYFIEVVKCCLLNCSMMVKISLQWLQQIISYDTTNLKKMVKFYEPTRSIFAGPITNTYVSKILFSYIYASTPRKTILHLHTCKLHQNMQEKGCFLFKVLA